MTRRRSWSCRLKALMKPISAGCLRGPRPLRDARRRRGSFRGAAKRRARNRYSRSAVMDSGLPRCARPRNDRSNRQSRNTRRERSSVDGGPFDHALELRVFLALGPTDRADLFQYVLRLEQIALLGVPHPVIGPGADVVRIGRERLLVPIFGVVIAPELAA